MTPHAWTIAAWFIWAFACFGVGLIAGRHFWGPKWFDTSKGIDRKFRKLKF